MSRPEMLYTGSQRHRLSAPAVRETLDQGQRSRVQAVLDSEFGGARSDVDSLQKPVYKGHAPQKEPLPEVKCRQLRELIRYVAALEAGIPVASGGEKTRISKYSPERMEPGDQLASIAHACFLVRQCSWRCREEIVLDDGDGRRIVLDEAECP